MKTSLKKLRGFALRRNPGNAPVNNRHDKRDRHRQQSLAQLDELSQASQDMQDMRDCYDSLLSAAAATANSAFEFSESLKEMGDCLLEKTALNEDEESGKVLLMLGKVQFELQKLIDSYRSHIFQTITVPSESLLNELRIVEEMKRQCDEKRCGYEEMVTRCREKGRLRAGSRGGEWFSSQQIQAARDDYEEDANVFVFRMKSLKRGQSRSLLTQAARHHAAQLRFFRKGLKSLETIEPHVKLVTEQQHIDYPFDGLEDDTADDSDNDDSDDSDDDDGEDGYEAHDDGELSFDYRLNDQGKDVSASRDSMELDNVELTFPQFGKTSTLKENRDRNRGGYSVGFSSDVNNKVSSKSAPLLAETDPSESTERFRESSSTRKLHAYVLPTPAERRHTVFAGSAGGGGETRAGVSFDLYHSSPLDRKRYEKVGNEIYSGPILTTPSVLRESNSSSSSSKYNKTSSSNRLPPPLQEGFSSPLLRHASDSKKIKRQAFSGPLTAAAGGNSWRISSASGPIGSTGSHQMLSGSLLRTPLPRPSSPPKSSPFVSSPKISELHELPRPPPHLSSSNNTSSNLIGHSAPLGLASTLPVPPPQSIPRSHSIPTSRSNNGSNSKPPLEAPPHNSIMVEDVSSPPLTPISLSNS